MINPVALFPEMTLPAPAADPPTAADGLMSRFGLSKAQAGAILEMRLQRLTGLERAKIVDEHREVLATIAHLEAVLGSEEMVLDIIVEELGEIRDRIRVPGGGEPDQAVCVEVVA